LQLLQRQPPNPANVASPSDITDTCCDDIAQPRSLRDFCAVITLAGRPVRDA
jgi:hypothetical protein